MTNTTNEIISINANIASLAEQMKEAMKTRDSKMDELCASIKAIDEEINKKEIEISKKQEKVSALKEKKEVAIAELEELKKIVNPFDKAPVLVTVTGSNDATKPVVSVGDIKLECKNNLPCVTESAPTTFSGKVLPAYEGKNDLRVKHPEGRMCFIKEGEAVVGKEYLFDVIEEGSYSSTYKVKVLSEVLACDIIKDEAIELPVVEAEGRGSLVEDSNSICYTCGEEVKNTPFAKLLAGVKVSK